MFASASLAGPAIRPTWLGPHDRYCCFLCCVLAGYAIFGKGFAYLGVPPLFVGEFALLAGILVVVRSGCAVAMLASVPSMLLLALIALVVARTASLVDTYGLDALRDSVIVVYGLFAFIVIALLIEKPERLARLLAMYGRFAWFYGFAGMIVMNGSVVVGTAMPSWPVSGIPLVFVRLGEGASHLAGAAVFALLGLVRVGPVWTILMVISLGMTAISRGAMLACIVPIALAALLSRQKRRFGYMAMLAAVLFGITYGAGLEFALPSGRSIGPEQIVNGLESIVGRSEEANLDGTKKWRLNWWEAIVTYTVHGPYFWTGKGFGVNLAEADGFVVGAELGGPPVRSPHNAHMTMLARTGVPGLSLWIATLAAWFGMLFRTMKIARNRGDSEWADILLWVACYGAAIVIDASFDVALEGPMLGIWFWCIFGTGIGAVMIYRTLTSRNETDEWRGVNNPLQ